MSRHTNLRRRDQDRREDGWVFRSAAPLQKHLVAVTGLDKSTISRMCSGDMPSVQSRWHDHVREVVRHGKADAGALIAGAMLVAEEAAVELGLEEVVRRLLDALSQETALQAAEDIAEQRLAVAIGRYFGKTDATDEDRAELLDAAEAHDEAVRKEIGREIDTVIYNRAMRVLLGWRVGATREDVRHG